MVFAHWITIVLRLLDYQFHVVMVSGVIQLKDSYLHLNALIVQQVATAQCQLPLNQVESVELDTFVQQVA
jgi:hypothetical protein